jgi:hypothetical protein
MKKLLLTLAIGFSMFVSASEAYTADIDSLVKTYSEKYSVPYKLAEAIVRIESGNNPKVRGQRGEYGLGQILCSTAKKMGYNGKCDGLKDPETNLTYSMLYLREALNIAENDVCYASAIYSSGNTAKPKRPTAYCRRVIKNME